MTQGTGDGKGTALSFLYPQRWMEVVGPSHVPTTVRCGKYVDIMRNETGWALRSVSKGSEKLAPSGFEPRAILPADSRYVDYVIAAGLSHVQTEIGIVVKTKTIDTERNYLSKESITLGCQDCNGQTVSYLISWLLT